MASERNWKTQLHCATLFPYRQREHILIIIITQLSLDNANSLNKLFQLDESRVSLDSLHQSIDSSQAVKQSKSSRCEKASLRQQASLVIEDSFRSQKFAHCLATSPCRLSTSPRIFEAKKTDRFLF